MAKKNGNGDFTLPMVILGILGFVALLKAGEASQKKTREVKAKIAVPPDLFGK